MTRLFLSIALTALLALISGGASAQNNDPSIPITPLARASDAVDKNCQVYRKSKPCSALAFAVIYAWMRDEQPQFEKLSSKFRREYGIAAEAILYKLRPDQE